MLEAIPYLLFIIFTFYICRDINKKGKMRRDGNYQENSEDEFNYGLKKNIIKHLFTADEIKTVTLDTNELRRVLSSNNLEKIDSYLLSLDVIFNGYPKNFTNIKEYLEILIDYAFKITDEKILWELLEVISLTMMYINKGEINLDRFEKNIFNVSTPILLQYLNVLHCTYDEKYLDTIQKFEKVKMPK